jgi:23S rRNA (uracil1939-C5)-methyltransferase
VRIDAIVPGGRGLARDDAGVILVEGALPGDLVRLSTLTKRGGARFASVESLVEPSPHRVVPDCDAHAVCGGCDLLALAPSEQVRVREGIVRDALRRIARLDDDTLTRVQPMVPAPLAARARRRVSLRVDARGRAGFSPRGSNTIVPRASCAALSPALEAALARLAAVGERALPPDARVRLATDDRGHVSLAVEDVAFDLRARAAALLFDAGVAHGTLALDEHGEPIAWHGDPVLIGEVAPAHSAGPFASDAATFTQATRHGAVTILDEVVRAARDLVEDAPVGEDVHILELFAGAGHLTLPLAGLGAHVVAVEGAARSVHWLVQNVERAHADRVRCIEGFIDGATFIDDYFEQLNEPPAILVVDPPRTGVPNFDGILKHLSPERIVMVSCDVATGARDLAIAVKHGYRLHSLVPIDAFPRTSHVEWVARLDAAS